VQATSVANGELSDTAVVYISGTVVKRLAGSNRTKTANEIANEGWLNEKIDNKGANAIVIASGNIFADALAGVPYAYQIDAPLLLTSNGLVLEDVVLEEIKSLQKERPNSAVQVKILGGSGTVRKEIFDQLANLGYQVERIAGSNRYATAVEIAKKLDAIRGKTADEYFIANGADFPDALSIGPVAAISNKPVLFTMAGTSDSGANTNAYTEAYIKETKPSKLTAVGGSGSVSVPAMELYQNNANVAEIDRVSGSNRAQTSIAIYQKYKSVFSSHDVTYATGAKFPDALAGGIFSAKISAPIFLVMENSLYPELQDIIIELKCRRIYIFGGTGTVSEANANQYLDLF
jgi:putative cell wall-binding protein